MPIPKQKKSDTDAPDNPAPKITEPLHQHSGANHDQKNGPASVKSESRCPLQKNKDAQGNQNKPACHYLTFIFHFVFTATLQASLL